MLVFLPQRIQDTAAESGRRAVAAGDRLAPGTRGRAGPGSEDGAAGALPSLLLLGPAGRSPGRCLSPGARGAGRPVARVQQEGAPPPPPRTLRGWLGGGRCDGGAAGAAGILLRRW